ncbi:MAG: hypothetical protein ACR5K4_04270 [Sodalis sp. (in: enterobacteria)]
MNRLLVQEMIQLQQTSMTHITMMAFIIEESKASILRGSAVYAATQTDTKQG